MSQLTTDPMVVFVDQYSNEQTIEIGLQDRLLVTLPEEPDNWWSVVQPVPTNGILRLGRNGPTHEGDVSWEFVPRCFGACKVQIHHHRRDGKPESDFTLEVRVCNR